MHFVVAGGAVVSTGVLAAILKLGGQLRLVMSMNDVRKHSATGSMEIDSIHIGILL